MTESVDEFRLRARTWLEQNAPLQNLDEVEEDLDVAVYLNVDPQVESENIATAVEWHQKKLASGFGALNYAIEHGGQGLTTAYVQAFRDEEEKFETPDLHEAFIVTTGMVAPTLRDFASTELCDQLLQTMLSGTDICCQMLSEPNAGSDLASLATRAVRHDDEWVIDGQKVWTSGGHVSKWGFLLARSNPDVPKHRGLTAFMIPLDTPGVELRPITQMTGGTAFNETFLTEVHIPDSLRVGDEGEGWRIIMSMLSYERSGTENWTAGGSYAQVRALAAELGGSDDPIVRQHLAGLYIGDRLIQWNAQMAAANHDGGPPGADANLGKLMYGRQMDRVTGAVSHILGARLTADADENYRWASHVVGTPGYHIAGGTDQIQLNILGERFLGLPTEPKH
jgi:alkylation response protein AidB-like acyl-CoA dehydrogenase